MSTPICAYCRFANKTPVAGPSWTCRAHASHVTGEPQLCEKVNGDGQCRKFEEVYRGLTAEAVGAFSAYSKRRRARRAKGGR